MHIYIYIKVKKSTTQPGILEMGPLSALQQIIDSNPSILERWKIEKYLTFA